MGFEGLLRDIAEYFQTFNVTKALQITYYTVALVLASIGLWKTIRYAEGKMPKRLLEFASREEGRIIEKTLKVLERIRRVPSVPQTSEYLDVNAEIDRAIGYLGRNDPQRAASELEQLATRLEDKIKVAHAQLALTRHQTAAVQLFLGTLAQKIPERAPHSLMALRRAAALRPDDPEAHKEIGLMQRDVADYPSARKAFGAYWQAAQGLDVTKRADKDLLRIDACRLTADCHRLEGSPDRERDELKTGLDIAETITDASMKPHCLRATLLEALGTNAHNRKTPQTDKIEEYLDRPARVNSAALRNKKREMTGKLAA